ncbi:MAG: hypothetical protein CMP10_00380 [Zetaproteobacteria bacterium]|jgi:hypothetical protein|nr:hypothetical protein [Pseudobdellovibrionaceae bacterium]
MIRTLVKRMYTTLNPYAYTKNIERVYPIYNELNMDIHRSIGEPNYKDDGYRLLVDVCHDTKTIFIDHDMCDYDELNDLPRIIKAFGCLYPKYTLKK